MMVAVIGVFLIVCRVFSNRPYSGSTEGATEFAGQENDRQKCRAGKCRTGK